MPSFSSSLLEAIYHSIDEPIGNTIQHQEVEKFVNQRRNKAATQVEEEIESLRRAIVVEKWIENYSINNFPRHLPSSSDSSTDSSIFSHSETDSKSTPKSSVSRPGNIAEMENRPKREGRFTRTKSRALKIYGDLKKVKEPISPGGKFTSFFNSIFSPRNVKENQGLEKWNSVRKSRSMKETTTTATCLLASRSCLSKNPSSKGNKSKRSVRFCPVSVILDEDCQPCGHKSIYDDEEFTISEPMASIGSQFIEKNIDSCRIYEGTNLREFHENDCDVDCMSCSSSDLFELETLGKVGIGAYVEELPVYETTSHEMNQAIARGVLM